MCIYKFNNDNNVVARNNKSAGTLCFPYTSTISPTRKYLLYNYIFLPFLYTEYTAELASASFYILL